jgi:signal peptidase II
MATSGSPLSAAARVRAAAPLLVLAAVVVVLDQISKSWILATLGRGAAVHQQDLLPGLLTLLYTENTGAAFGMLPGGGWALGILAGVVAVGILAYAPRLHDPLTGAARPLPMLSLGLVLGGALGNLVDRQQHGFVVDFLHWPWATLTLGGRLYTFPNFNVADSGITVGIILLIAYLTFLDPDRHAAGAASSAPTPDSAANNPQPATSNPQSDDSV